MIDFPMDGGDFVEIGDSGLVPLSNGDFYNVLTGEIVEFEEGEQADEDSPEDD